MSEYDPIDFSGIDELKVNFTHTITAKTEAELINKLHTYMDKCKFMRGFDVYNEPIPFCPKSYKKLIKLAYWTNLSSEDMWLLSGHITLSKPWGRWKAEVSYWDMPDNSS